MTIDKEDFEQWRAHPITEAVNAALMKLAERNKQKWIDVSWEGGVADPVALAELKARYQTSMDVIELTVDELNEALNDERKDPAAEQERN